MKDFKIQKEHLGSLNINSEDHGFNAIVVCLHPFQEDKDCVGRVVQVRKNSGAFGSDIILIRKMTGDLQSWENQSFFNVTDEYKNYYQTLFKDIELDEPNIEYSIQGKYKVKGFVVEDMDCTDGKIYSTTIATKKSIDFISE